MILWGRASSVNVQKVLWALDELGAGYDHRVVGGRYGGRDDPDFAGLTPTRKVPVLEDGPVAVWESNAILRHLGRRFPDHVLAARISLADPWMDFGTATLQPPFIGLFWQMVRMREKDRSSDTIAKHREGLAAAMDVMERHLAGGGQWLAGSEGPGLAEMAVGTPFYRIGQIAPDLLAERACLANWVDRMAARPGWQRHVATSYDELLAD